MNKIIYRSFVIALLLSLFSIGIVLAHGQPTIRVEPSIATPGGQITIIGADMENGEVYKITLENGSGTVQLGQATAITEGEEAGFTVVFSLPNILTEGFYLLRATTNSGETTAADLTIVSSASEANSEPMKVDSSQHTLDRSKPPLLVGAVIVLILLSAGLGVWLVRML